MPNKLALRALRSGRRAPGLMPRITRPRHSRGLQLRNLVIIVDEMPRREFIGGFELLVLLALIRLGDEAYGVPIASAIAESSGREVAQGSVYITLDRLSRKGFVTSRMGEPTAERGGRAKTYFRITAKGLRVARRARQMLVKLWKGVPQLEGGTA